MRNLQIALDDQSMRMLDKFAKAEHRTRAALVREAIQSWIRERQVLEFEQKWIRAAQRDSAATAPEVDAAWMAAESWEQT